MAEKQAIVVTDLNKKFKSGYGIENINLVVKPGKVFGYLGPNGAGKSTTIRTIMGFIKPDSGNSKIMSSKLNPHNVEDIISYDSWTDGDKIQKVIGYVPGEIAFPEFMTGIELLKMVFRLRNMTDWEDVKKYIYYWEFDPNLKIKKMSKGMKQKLALCIAWMHNPDIIILDEPTSGLDPLMQEKFVSLMKQSKEAGKAVIMSSHIFSEIEKTCDYVSIIKHGKIVSTIDINDIKYNSEKVYEIKFKTAPSAEFLNSKTFKLKEQISSTLIVNVLNQDINDFISLLAKQDLEFFKEHPLDLEEYFMKYYQNEIKTDVIEKIENYSESVKQKNSKISFELMRHSFKKSIILWTFLCTLLLFFTSILFISMKVENVFDIDPSNPEAAYEISQIMGIIIPMLVGNLGYILMVIYILVSSTALVATEVERGTMVNLLTTNQSRKSVILTKMSTFIILILSSALLQTIVTYIFIYAFGIQNYINLGWVGLGFIGSFLLLFFVGGIGILFSTTFNKTALSLATTGAIIIISFVLNQVSGTPQTEWLKYFSINTLFNLSEISSPSDLGSYLGQYIFLGLGGAAMYVGSYFIFTKKDLPL
ncbi:hypothetical protein SCLARK_00453 [Spiroplasma clarkii]|uniref:ABC transporter ATP-binding protein n=1 Tax=Spiroplasma clarkii TaxID=2139 RepID=A0A1Y0L0D7_9MOLU|nr:ATP-binding cassette domain-containing protein [Spiroplasma clarkii]ARU91169.1 hypothetical protein SCLARK_00453 [Spiroplasma clarkii]ATX70609.1 ABC transporter ATP-binding protein [Spiroplasma clarkii]